MTITNQSDNAIAVSQMPTGGMVGRFTAMASPCEVLVDSNDVSLATRITQIAQTEASRIEKTFSRYRTDNILYKINNAQGKSIDVDSELAKLLDFADATFQASDGKFDITSGVLRNAWKFDGTSNIPNQSDITPLLKLVGWNKVSWANQQLTMPNDMQIDLGGIGKEYAVDCAGALISATTDVATLVNFGGDLLSTGVPSNGHWTIGVSSADKSNGMAIKIKQGALATSGDAYRYLIANGKRYCHVLDATTGWPAINSPSSVTVAASNCVQAGVMATLAMLQGDQAEQYLNDLDVRHWIQR